MYVPFKELSSQSKVWIYQSDKKITKDAELKIKNKLKEFVENWTAHSQVLKSSFDIRYNFFIILSIDESLNKASGCSVDSLFRVIKEIEEICEISLLSRENLAFFIDDEVVVIELKNIKDEIKKGNINTQSIFFNNFANYIEELPTNWMIPIEKTWLKKYF